MIQLRTTLSILLFFLVISGCTYDYTPKPRGFFRIGLPPKKYQAYDPAECPYSFDLPVYARVVPDNRRFAEPCWSDIEFPAFNAVINLSYKPLENNLNKYIEDSRTLVYKHTVKADAIDEKVVSHPDNHVYGLLYDIGGDAASSVQFYLTDSTHHFLRGALYFNVAPQHDSLAPVISFISDDIIRMITTLRWKQ